MIDYTVIKLVGMNRFIIRINENDDIVFMPSDDYSSFTVYRSSPNINEKKVESSANGKIKECLRYIAEWDYRTMRLDDFEFGNAEIMLAKAFELFNNARLQRIMDRLSKFKKKISQ